VRALAEKITSAMLGKGYFPKELPPVFTTVDFGAHAIEIVSDWEKSALFKVKSRGKFKGSFMRGSYSYEGLKPADPEIISKPKRIYERRNIHITHPIPQALLTKEIAENWRQLQRILSQRKFSEDEIAVSENFDRSIKGINFPLHRAKKSYIEATADWLVKTDISRFYPTIYTHSIPWAAYGKEKVKQKLELYKGTFADRLDVLVRNCNRNQTVGIPIGPETSRILAEIVSSRIDSSFAERQDSTDRMTIDRLQDDWVVGAKSLADAERILSIISLSYRDFGLEINGSKTSITHILASNVEGWKSEISGFLSHRRGGLQGARLGDFLNLCLRLQLGAPGEPVMNYALSILEGKRFPRSDIQVIESFLLKASAIAPSSLDRVCRIVLNLDFQTGGLSKDRLTKRFVELAEAHFLNGNYFEVIWLLYTIRGLKKPFVSSKIAECSEFAPSSAIRLLLLDLKSMGSCLSNLPVTAWESELSEDRVLSDWSWLYAYEGIRKGWLSDTRGLLTKPFFSAMAKRNIVFYDPKRNVKRSTIVKRDQFALRKAQNQEVIAFLNSVRHVGFLDDPDWSEY
jgi:hypothetical protein